jgi:hypothetical protein
VLLIVMDESGTWHVRPGETLTFGRGEDCTIRLAAGDRGLSRAAGTFAFEDGAWWLSNDSASSVLYLSGDRGFRVDLPPGMRIPVQLWHAKVRLHGVLDTYTLRLRLPDLDDVPDGAVELAPGELAPGEPGPASIPLATRAVRTDELVTNTRYRARLTDSDRLVLAARFEEYLTWRHSGSPAPRSAKDTADRIGWQPHTVTKRCENLRDRYSRLGFPGLRGPRALEELAALLISTGELTADDLHRLPAPSSRG